ncbi:MAG: hypothetical protein EPO08_05305 [Rhodospirillaceae bacterium]|nr:MAG: hypothetical protein EPO08_05305 [Rhodospirillaceae bacterium]
MRLRHPLTRLIYDRQADGSVRVGEGDQSGVFDRRGNWLSGNRKSADPMLCWLVSDGHLPAWNRVAGDSPSKEAQS